MAATQRSQDEETPITPGAAILAWLLPGAGHIAHGQTKRGVVIMIGVLFLFISGLLIGGVDVVDRKEDKLWFIAQVFCGPIALGADYANQHFIKGLPPVDRNQTTSLGRVNEIGTLYCALAGLMNLVIILDALHFTPRSAPIERRSSKRSTDAQEPAT